MSHPKIVTKPEFSEANQMWSVFSNIYFLDTVWFKTEEEAYRSTVKHADQGCSIVFANDPLVKIVKRPDNNFAAADTYKRLMEIGAAKEQAEKPASAEAPATLSDEFAFLSAPKPSDTPVTLRRDAMDTTERWEKDFARSFFLLNAEDRIQKVNEWLNRLATKGYTSAQAQLIAFAFLSFIHNAGTGNVWTANFTEKLHEQLVDKVSAFGAKAHPLTDKQFEAAVKAAW